MTNDLVKMTQTTVPLYQILINDVFKSLIKGSNAT